MDNNSNGENLKIIIEDVKKFWCDLLISTLDNFKDQDNKFKQEEVLESRKWLKRAADTFFSFKEEYVNDYWKGLDFMRFTGYVYDFLDKYRNMSNEPVVIEFNNRILKARGVLISKNKEAGAHELTELVKFVIGKITPQVQAIEVRENLELFNSFLEEAGYEKQKADELIKNFLDFRVVLTSNSDDFFNDFEGIHNFVQALKNALDKYKFDQKNKLSAGRLAELDLFIKAFDKIMYNFEEAYLDRDREKANVQKEILFEFAKQIIQDIKTEKSVITQNENVDYKELNSEIKKNLETVFGMDLKEAANLDIKMLTEELYWFNFIKKAEIYNEDELNKKKSLVHDFLNLDVNYDTDLMFSEEKIKIVKDFIDCIDVCFTKYKKCQLEQNINIFSTVKCKNALSSFILLKEQVDKAINYKNYDLLAVIVNLIKKFGSLLRSPFCDKENSKIYLRGVRHPLKSKQDEDFKTALKNLNNLVFGQKNSITRFDKNDIRN